MKKNYIKTILFSSSMMVFCLGVFAQTNNKKTESKLVTTPLKKDAPRFTAVERPISNDNSSAAKKVSNSNSANSNTVIGEGKYLMFTKKIMEFSATGQIPDGFPKHVKGQSKEQYIEVMKTWAKQNKDKIKPAYHNEIN